MDTWQNIFCPTYCPISATFHGDRKLNIGVCCKEKRVSFFNEEVRKVVRASNGMVVILSDKAMAEIKAVYDETHEPLLVVVGLDWKAYCAKSCSEMCRCQGSCGRLCLKMCCGSCYKLYQCCQQLVEACRTPTVTDTGFIRSIWFGKVDVESKYPGFANFFGPAALLFLVETALDYYAGYQMADVCPETVMDRLRRITTNEIVRRRVHILPEDVALFPIDGLTVDSAVAERQFAIEAARRAEALKKYPKFLDDSTIQVQPSAIELNPGFKAFEESPNLLAQVYAAEAAAVASANAAAEATNNNGGSGGAQAQPRLSKSNSSSSLLQQPSSPRSPRASRVGKPARASGEDDDLLNP